NLECQRLGVPVLAARVGGIPDTIGPGLGHLFEPNCPPGAVADLLQSFARDPEAYLELRRRVLRAAPAFTWRRAVADLVALWRGAEPVAASAPPPPSARAMGSAPSKCSPDRAWATRCRPCSPRRACSSASTPTSASTPGRFACPRRSGRNACDRGRSRASWAGACRPACLRAPCAMPPSRP